MVNVSTYDHFFEILCRVTPHNTKDSLVFKIKRKFCIRVGADMVQEPPGGGVNSSINFLHNK